MSTAARPSGRSAIVSYTSRREPSPAGLLGAENLMANELVLLHFDNAESAEATMSVVRTLQAEGFLELDDAAILTRSPTGSVEVTPADMHDAPKKTTVGAVIGLVAGSLVGLPVLGAMAAGTIAGTKEAKKSAERLDAVLAAVSGRIEAGATVLALSVAAIPDPEIVIDRLSIHRDEMTRVDIPADLRTEIERATDDQA